MEKSFFEDCKTLDDLKKQKFDLEWNFSGIDDPATKQQLSREYEEALKRIRKERRKTALLGMAMLVATSVILGAFFALFDWGNGKPYWEAFKSSVYVCYLLFGAGATLGGLITLGTNLDEDLSFGFGYGLFLGTIVPAAWICDWIDYHHWIFYALTFTISALICYIVWLKKKEK